MRYLVKPLARGTFMRHVNADMIGAEEQIRESGLDWTIVRPPRLTNEPATGAYRTAIDQNLSRGLTVSRADLAAYLLAIIGDRATIRHHVGIAR